MRFILCVLSAGLQVGSLQPLTEVFFALHQSEDYFESVAKCPEDYISLKVEHDSA